MTFTYFTSVSVLAVVQQPGAMRRFVLAKPDTGTQIPIMHLARLRNVPAPVGEAVDSSQEQAEVGKQNKHMKKRVKTTQNFYLILYSYNV